MGFSVRPALLKAYVSWFKSGFFLRLLGLPAALTLVYFEIYGSSPQVTALLLHRLSRRLRLQQIAAILANDKNATGLNHHFFPFFPRGADVMPRAQSQSVSNLPSSRPAITLDDKDRTTPRGSAPVKEPQHQPGPDDDGSETSATLSDTDSSLATMPAQHSRSQSNVEVLRKGNRLSLQFPIQPLTATGAASPRSRPQSWVAAPSPLQSPDTVSTPATNLLAIVAAQERYVLELKEELSKAEQDLQVLKKHHATQEVFKLRDEVKNVTRLQTLNTTAANYGSDQDDEDGSALWMQKEMERRKAILNGTKTSQRKVFSGSRHLRTLSLLSPVQTYTPSFPQPLDLQPEPSTAPHTTTHFNSQVRTPPLSRASTNSVIANRVADTNPGERYDMAGLSNAQRDALLRTGKQMATDFKDGLLTFIKDIQQATVGEEPVLAAEQRGPSAKGTRKASDARPTLPRATSSKKSLSSNQLIDIGDDFWKEHGLSEPRVFPTDKKTHASKQIARTPQKQTATQLMAEEFEDWDNWDTPNDKHAVAAKEVDTHSSDESDGASSPVSRQASSRTSTRYHSQRHDSKASTLTSSSSAGVPDDALFRDPKRNSIPWPDLVKYSPTNLKRTASHLMKEWEKNLTPPPESKEASHSSGDYIGRGPV
jgi:hypothetical protein